MRNENIQFHVAVSADCGSRNGQNAIVNITKLLALERFGQIIIISIQTREASPRDMLGFA